MVGLPDNINVKSALFAYICTWNKDYICKIYTDCHIFFANVQHDIIPIYMI